MMKLEVLEEINYSSDDFHSSRRSHPMNIEDYFGIPFLQTSLTIVQNRSNSEVVV